MNASGLTSACTRVLACAAAFAAVAVALPAAAGAGTYVIENCPSAPAGDGDSGPWTIFGSPQASKGGCSAGAGDWVGPRGGSMAAGSADGVQVTVPSESSVTIREAKVWWAVPHQISGADTFAVTYADGAGVGESQTPAGWQSSPDVLVLPSSTRTLKLEDYCSNDDAGEGCVFGAGENADLELFGAQLTLADSRPPSGEVTGGGLAGSGALTGMQSLAYNVGDADSGVRLARLLIDGTAVASNDYIADCPYTSFLACPSSESDALTWNTASVADGQHTLALAVQDAAQNTSIIDAGTITTANAPTNSTPPSILPGGQPLAGSTISAQDGEWTLPSGAGSLTYTLRWQDCDTQGVNCTPVAGASGDSYTPGPDDVGHTLRVLVSAADNDGATSLQSAPSAMVSSPPAPTGLPAGLAITTPGEAPGLPNGRGASEAAQLRLAGRTTIARSFAGRALRISGTLSGQGGTSIAGATLDLDEQRTGGRVPELIGHTTTRANGSFTADVLPGGSRVITIGYRAFSGALAYTTQASITETVSAGVQMHITPAHTTPTGRITLAGQVAGTIPHEGLVVELLVHYRGAWEPLRTPRTDSRGQFRAVYEFQGAVGRFPFRAEVFGGQAGFPYATGRSPVVDVQSD